MTCCNALVGLQSVVGKTCQIRHTRLPLPYRSRLICLALETYRAPHQSSLVVRVGDKRGRGGGGGGLEGEGAEE